MNQAKIIAVSVAVVGAATWFLMRAPAEQIQRTEVVQGEIRDAGTDTFARIEPPQTATKPDAAEPVPAKMILGVLVDQSYGEGDCGCELKGTGAWDGKKIFVLNLMEHEDRARIHLSGQDVWVDREGSPRSDLKRPPDAGATYSERWRVGGTTVLIDFTKLNTCFGEPKGDEMDCEGTDLQAQITVEADGVEETHNAVGYCGC